MRRGNEKQRFSSAVSLPPRRPGMGSNSYKHGAAYASAAPCCGVTTLQCPSLPA